MGNFSRKIEMQLGPVRATLAPTSHRIDAVRLRALLHMLRSKVALRGGRLLLGFMVGFGALRAQAVGGDPIGSDVNDPKRRFSGPGLIWIKAKVRSDLYEQSRPYRTAGAGRSGADERESLGGLDPEALSIFGDRSICCRRAAALPVACLGVNGECQMAPRVRHGDVGVDTGARCRRRSRPAACAALVCALPRGCIQSASADG
jgi:hypothetical protein